MSRWSVVTETEANLPNDAIPFVMTKNDRDTAQIIRCDIERMQRNYREPEGLVVGIASIEEFQEARELFIQAL